MIERTIIDGKPATVAYLKGEMQPATKEDYTSIKVIFDDGNVIFARRAPEVDTTESGRAGSATFSKPPSDFSIGEDPDISRQEEAWLRTVIEDLGAIYKIKGHGSHGNEAFCMLEIGRVYLQCLAKCDREEILVEAVSTVSDPQIELSDFKKSLLETLGYKPPGISPNYSQTIQIAARGDIERVAKLAFMTLGFVYDVREISGVDIRVCPPSIADNSVKE